MTVIVKPGSEPLMSVLWHFDDGPFGTETAARQRQGILLAAAAIAEFSGHFRLRPA
jgi:hypothetical protein